MTSITATEHDFCIRRANALTEMVFALDRGTLVPFETFLLAANIYDIYYDVNHRYMRRKSILEALNVVRSYLTGKSDDTAQTRRSVRRSISNLIVALEYEAKRDEIIAKADVLANALEPLFAVSSMFDNQRDRAMLMNVATAMSLRVLPVIWNDKHECKRAEALKSTFRKFHTGQLTSLQFRAHIRAIFLIK